MALSPSANLFKIDHAVRITENLPMLTIESIDSTVDVMQFCMAESSSPVRRTGLPA